MIDNEVNKNCTFILVFFFQLIDLVLAQRLERVLRLRAQLQLRLWIDYLSCLRLE